MTSPSPKASASPATRATAPVATEPSREGPRASPKLGPRPPFDPESVVWTVSPNVRVRSKPRVSSDSVKYEPLLPKGTVLSVLEGPVTGSGFWWYKIELLDKTLRGGRTTGWVAAGDHDGTPWIGYLDGLSGPDTDPLPEYEGPDLPEPVLHFQGTEPYVVDGTSWTRFALSVVNWADYSAESFGVGLEADACRRTWVYIFDHDRDEQIDSFCDLREPSDLTGIWFAVPDGTAPPARVLVVIEDTFTGAVVESNSVGLAF